MTCRGSKQWSLDMGMAEETFEVLGEDFAGTDVADRGT
jgi:hypothetical protein